MGQHRTSLSPPHRAARRRPLRAAALGSVLAAGSAAVTLVLGRQAWQAWPGPDATSAQAALLALTLVASTVLTGWVTTVLALAAADLAHECRDGRHPRRWAGRTVGWTGAALLAITAAPGQAAVARPPEPSWTSVSTDEVSPVEVAAGSVTGSPTASDVPAPPEQRLLPDGSPVPLPGWTPVPVPPTATPATSVGLVSAAPREAPPDGVVVRAGDTLWSIAARQLGPSATVQDVAEEWPRWYAANRDLIGPDPDLILPGQELRIPPPAGAGGPAAGQDEGAGR